jgi:hypothetical protein
MICVRLLGGFGNQLFQRAFGMSLEERGYKVCYDRSALVEGTHREYSLGPDLKFGPTTEKVVTEQSMPFDLAMVNPEDGSTMLGYWQSEKYFPMWSDPSFKPFAPLSPKAQELAQQIKGETFIHVRRGDYLRLQHFHGMPSMSYYRNAIDYVRRRFTTRFFVFSDDPAWCKTAFPEFVVVDGLTKYEDLYLMLQCHNAIIANSSFSWWGAWMATNLVTDGLVIAPQRWFTDPNVDARDIVPERWIRLEN